MLLYHERCKGIIDINKASRDDWQRVEPPLVTACRLGNKEAVQLLVDSGADLNAMDNYFHTALWMATRQRNSYLANLLIMRGASVNVSDQWFQSPLYLAVRYAKRNDIAKILILNGSNVDIKGDKPFKWSLFHWATLYGAYDVAKLLVHAGYNVSSESKSNTAPVQYSQEFSDWLVSELRTVPPLQRQCRAVIRKCISNKTRGRFFVKHIKQLPLPRSLIANVAMQEFVPDKLSI